MMTNGIFLDTCRIFAMPSHIHDHAVVDVVPEPGENLFPDLDKDLVVIGGDLLQIFSRLLPDSSEIPLALFRLRRRLLHEGDKALVPENHADDLFPGLQQRAHDRRLLLIDPCDQLPAELSDDFIPGQRLPGLHDTPPD